MRGPDDAWGWLAHLRAGGTTPWPAWSGPGIRDRRALPGAQQLELLRRLNLSALPRDGHPSPDLAERVLTVSAPGRGRPDFDLVGAAEVLRFGPPPVDPTTLPVDELIRVATGVLADEVLAVGGPEQPEQGEPVMPSRRLRARLGQGRYRLVGDPWLADPIRADLVSRGRPPGGRGAVTLVLGADLSTMLADVWTARAFAEGAPAWDEWLAGLERRQALPPRIDLVRIAGAWAGRVGRDRVRIVLDPRGVRRLLGARTPLPAPPVLAADAVDLSRRVAAALGLLVTPPRRAELLHQVLLPRLRDAPGEPLGVPPERWEWVRRRADRLRQGIAGGGYAVHGDPAAVVPTGPVSGGASPSEAAVLEIALGLMLDQDRNQERNQDRNQGRTRSREERAT